MKKDKQKLKMKPHTDLLYTCAPPPLTGIHKGATCVFPFSQEKGYYLGIVLEDFLRKNGKEGVFLGNFQW